MRCFYNLLVVATAVSLTKGRALGVSEFDQKVRPILEEKCFDCHGPEKQKGKVRLDTLSTDLVKDARAAETWHDTLEVLHLGEMPPEDEEQLTKEERAALVGWLTAEVEKAAQSQRLAGTGTVIRRINRDEYQNTMRDLLGLDIDYGGDLPPDTVSADGFANNGAALGISDLQLELYLAAARSALSRAIVTGPKPEVITYTTDESDRSTKGIGVFGNRLGRVGAFVAKSVNYPFEGDFLVRIKAHGEMKEGAPVGQMRVEIGFQVGGQRPSRLLGIADVRDPESQIYQFRGRIEEFPIQDPTQAKYPGLLLVVENAYDDGEPPPKPKSVEVVDAKGKKKKKKIIPEDPDFPKIVIESVEFTGPVFEVWPPEHHARILFDPEGIETKGELKYASEVLEKFMCRAFRRPVRDEDVSPFLRFFEKVRPGLGSFEEAIRETLAMVLISPDFLYLVEPSQGAKKRALDDHELASRLSYFLWSSMPDARLFELAELGKLRDAQTLAREVERMLDAPKAWAFVEQFSDQWLDLGGIDRVAIDPNYYPKFDNALKLEMRRETQHFFAEILRTDSSALQFLDSDFAMLNESLARHYGIVGPRGSSFERVSLKPEDRRGGVLGQAGILLANSSGADSHPIKRGVWIRERLLDDPPAAPPANVPNLDDTNPDFAKLPLKKQLEIHLEDPACADCHEGIDRWGVAMEDFDAVGKWREEILRKAGKKSVRHPVDSAVTLPDGGEVDGVAELKAHLLAKRKGDFAEALVKKLLTYGLGRSLGLGDRNEVGKLTERFVKDGYRLRGLVGQIVLSEAFQTK